MSLSKQKYLQKCKPEYLADFTFFKKSSKGDHHVYCMECSADIGIGHGGRGDIIQHINSKKHINFVSASEKNSKIDNFFCEKPDDLEVIRAECLVTSFIVEHNLPINCADHVGNLLRKIFPKNEIAKKYACARTKTNALIAEFASSKQKTSIDVLKGQVFSIATDATNDSDSKLFPLVVTYFNDKQRKIVHELFALPILKGDCTGQNIGNLILEKLDQHDIPLENCISYMADNASVMLGNKAGVAAILRQKHPNIFILGCLCHKLNLASEKGASCLPLKIDEILVDVYFYLDKSSKRKKKLKEFQEFYNGEVKKILKHSPTRWLSITKCLERLITEWEPLTQFFMSELKADKSKLSNFEFYKIPKKKVGESSEKNMNTEENKNEKNVGETSEMKKDINVNKNVKKVVGKSSEKKKITNTNINKNTVSKKRPSSTVSCSDSLRKKKKVSNEKQPTSILTREERLFYILTSDVNKAYCLFILYIHPVFDKLNVAFQSQTPLIHKVRKLLIELYKDILMKFVKISIIKESSDILSIKYHSSENQKNDEDILIGENASCIVKKLSIEDRKIFYCNVKDYYLKTCDYIILKFPFDCELLKHAEMCSVKNIENASFSSVKYFVETFPKLLKDKKLNENLDILNNEFFALQVYDIPETIMNEEKIDMQWALISSIKDELNAFRFKNISEIMLGILTIAHSNAECERVFSTVKKNRTEFRSTLSDQNLENLLLMKSNFSGYCYEQNFDKKFLLKAKSASTRFVQS